MNKFEFKICMVVGIIDKIYCFQLFYFVVQVGGKVLNELWKFIKNNEGNFLKYKILKFLLLNQNVIIILNFSYFGLVNSIKI